MRCYAETTGGDLLDLGHALGPEALGIFAPLPRVGARADSVHRRRQCLVCLRTKRPQRHAGGIEARQDLFDGLNVFQAEWLGRFHGPQQVPQGGHRALVDQLGVTLVNRVITTGHSLLQRHHHIRVECMVLLAVHIFEQAALFNAFSIRPGPARQGFHFLFEFAETTALNARCDTTEGQVYDLPRQTNCLEQLGATIGADRGYAHFGHNLEQALVDSLAVVFVTGTGLTQDLTAANQFLQHTVREVGIDRGRAKAEQTGNLVGIASAGRFDDDIGVDTQALLDQVVMHSPGSQQAVNRQGIAVDSAVG